MERGRGKLESGEKMKKKLLFFFVCCLALTACSQTKSASSEKENQLEEEKPKLTESLNKKEKEVASLNQKIDTLEKEKLNLTERLNEKEDGTNNLAQQIDALEKQVADFKKQQENFPFISSIAREFVQAYTTGNKDELQRLLSDNITLTEKNNQLYVEINGQETRLSTEDDLLDWQLNSYYYDSDKNTFEVSIEEFSKEGNDFTNLSLQKLNDEWKIIDMSFDT